MTLIKILDEDIEWLGPLGGRVDKPHPIDIDVVEDNVAFVVCL